MQSLMCAPFSLRQSTIFILVLVRFRKNVVIVVVIYYLLRDFLNNN
jgi:hypothetical protein